jgi:hypothetical protein
MEGIAMLTPLALSAFPCINPEVILEEVDSKKYCDADPISLMPGFFLKSNSKLTPYHSTPYHSVSFGPRIIPYFFGNSIDSL